MSDEVMSNSLTPEEISAEQALRPETLRDFVGQKRVKDQVDLLLRAARERGAPADHILFSGPPGLGKTTLAMIVASEMDSPIRITSGPAITYAGDLASILSSLVEGEVLFLDEIHRMEGQQKRCSIWRWRILELMLWLAKDQGLLQFH